MKPVADVFVKVIQAASVVVTKVIFPVAQGVAWLVNGLLETILALPATVNSWPSSNPLKKEVGEKLRIFHVIHPTQTTPYETTLVCMCVCVCVCMRANL